MSGWDKRAAIAQKTSVAEIQKQRLIDDNQLAPGYEERTFRDALGKEIRYAIRIDPRGQAEGYELKDSFKVRQARSREWLPAEQTQVTTFQQLDMQDVQISEVEDVATGVIGSAVVIGGIRPHAFHPGNWNVLTHRTATLNGEFSALTLPKPALLSDMLISASVRADVSGSEQETTGLVHDPLLGGSGANGQTVVFDDGFTIDPDHVQSVRLTHPIASVLADQQEGNPAWSVEVTAICDHEGIDALEDHLLSVRMVPQNGVIYDGLRWAGMLQHDVGVGQITVRPSSTQTATVLEINGLPDPRTYVLGSEDYPDPAEVEGATDSTHRLAPPVPSSHCLLLAKMRRT